MEEDSDILLKMTIDLGQLQDTLVIHNNDKAHLLAHHFVKKHGLSSKVVPILTQNIQENID